MRRSALLTILTLLTLSLPVVVVACGGPPEARVSPSALSGPAPLTVDFTNDSMNADTYEWDFGDGTNMSTSSAEPVAHEYTKAGTYTVALRAIKQGDPPVASTTIADVTVGPGPLHHVALLADSADVQVSGSLQFAATALDRFDNIIPGLTYTFRSPADAGTMDSRGRFTAGTKAGNFDEAVTVVVAQGDLSTSATASVAIQPGTLDRVKLEPAPAVLTVTE